MLGLRTPRRLIAECVDLINRVKVNIDDFKQKIKKDREEVESQIEDIKLLKQFFASLDGVLDDFSNIYVGDVITKEWDYLFPQIIQSLIDVDCFMQNQLPKVYGFNPAKDLSAYISFTRSIKRLKKIASGQTVELKPTLGAETYVESKIGSFKSISSSFIPFGHPKHCTPVAEVESSIDVANMSIEDKMKSFAGRYKINGRFFEPYCKGWNPNIQPEAFASGWIEFIGQITGGNGDWNCCPIPGTCGNNPPYSWDKLKTLWIPAIESTREEQDQHPNKEDGGCGRSFLDYYTDVVDRISISTPITVSIIPNLESGNDNGRKKDLVWIKATFSSAVISHVSGRFGIIFSSVENVEYSEDVDGFFNLIRSSRSSCNDNDYCQNDISWFKYLNPTYYYIFIEDDWIIKG